LLAGLHPDPLGSSERSPDHLTDWIGAPREDGARGDGKVIEAGKQRRGKRWEGREGRRKEGMAKEGKDKLVVYVLLI